MKRRIIYFFQMYLLNPNKLLFLLGIAPPVHCWKRSAAEQGKRTRIRDGNLYACGLTDD